MLYENKSTAILERILEKIKYKTQCKKVIWVCPIIIIKIEKDRKQYQLFSYSIQ